MSKDILIRAEKYYTAMREKNSAELETYLHPDVTFIAPLGKSEGKAAFLGVANGFMGYFKSLVIRAKFASADQAVVIYDVSFPGQSTDVASAALLTFEGGLIKSIELFYDASSAFRK